MSAADAGRGFFRLHRATSLAVAALGFVALRVAGELSDAVALVALATLALSAWERRPRLPARAWLVVQLLFLAWLAYGWLLGGRHVLTSFAALLIFVQLHRLLTRSSSRDDLYSYFIAFGQLLLSSVLTVSAAWFAVFVAFFVVLTWALLLSRLARAVERDRPASAPAPPLRPEAFAPLRPLMRWRWGLAVTALSLGMLVSTLVLFFVLPRLQASFLSASLLPPIPVSGFSEQVRLGEIGLLQLSDEPVMRVHLSRRDRQPASATEAYWHGLAMDAFDGRTWSLSDSRRTRLGWVGGSESRGPPRDRPWTVRQEIALEALDTSVLFHQPRATGLYGDFRTLEAADTEGYYVPGPRMRRSYVVYSEPARSELELLRRQDPRHAPERIRAPYTQLPPGLSPRIGELADGWTRGAATAADEALLIQERLRADFTYSLAQPSSASPDPLLAFLEEFQEGHCEYFATAMVVMLRGRGIPARIVNGFHGGEYNPVGDYWLVRQRDAHSWVEAWFGELGWVTFDPTPLGAGGVRGRARIRALARLAAWADYGRVRWTEVMLDYGLDNQAEGLRRGLAWLSGDSGYSLVRLLLQGSGSSRPAEERPVGGRRRIGVGLGLVALVLLAGLVRLRRPARRGRQELPPELVRAARLATRLEQRWRRSARRDPTRPGPEATILSWASWASDRSERLARAPVVIEQYYAVRFGSVAPSADLVQALKGLLRASRRLRPQSASTGQNSSAE